jgi:hypothetical protein
MHWVWNHSQSKGTARHCLLALADKAQGADCMAAMGMTEFMQRANASRSAVLRSLDQLLKSGELKIEEEARGSRPALYELPLAVDYVRPKPGVRGSKKTPVDEPEGYQNATPKDAQGCQNATQHESANGSDSLPEGCQNDTPRGSKTLPLYQTSSTKSGRAIDADAEQARPDDGIPDFARPLVDSCTVAGVAVRWPFNSGEWIQVHAAIKKSGVQALAAYALKTWQKQRGDIDSARFFLRNWTTLAPLPSADAERPQLRAVSGGWQPYTNPTDHSVYENGFK